MRGKLFLAFGWMTLFLMGTDVFVISPLLPLVSTHFGVSVASAGLGMTVFAFSYAVLAPVFGHYGDGHGRRGPIVGGLLTLGLCNVATALAPTFHIFLAARLVAGGAAAAITPSIYAATSDAAPPEKRGAWLAIVGSGVFTALWSSAPLGSLLGYRVGWPPVFLILGVVPLLLALVNGGVMKNAVHSGRVARGGYGRLMADVALTTLWGTSLYSVYTYLGAGLLSDGHCTPGQISIAIAIYGVGMVTGGITGGHLADRWGSREVTAASCLLMAAAVLVFRRAIAHYAAALLMLYLYSFSAALFFPSFQAFLARRHTERRGSALAWNNSALYVGITVGSFVGGEILRRSGFLAIPFLSVLFAMLALGWAQVVQRNVRTVISGATPSRSAGPQ